MSNRCEKSSYEIFTISTDFSKNFVPLETIASQTVTATTKGGVDATATVTNQATLVNDGGSKVSIVVRAGSTADSPYTIKFRCVTSTGHKWEHDVQLKVKD